MPSWSNNEKPEVSPGGSRVLRYNEPPRPGSGGTNVSEFQAQREAVYNLLFGEAQEVYHEILPAAPHIDVYIYPPHQDVKYWTLVTGGMSDLPMNMPAHIRGMKDGPPSRVELVFYCKESRKDYMETLRHLAHFPHTYQTWIGASHTAPNGNPAAALWDFAPELDTVLFMPSLVRAHQLGPEQLVLGGDRVDFLWVIPLTSAECEFKLARGYNALLGLFQKHRHPHVFDPARISYV